MLALSGKVELCVSDAIFAEYDEVIRRPHLKRPPEAIEGTLELIRRLGHWVKPRVRVAECTDPDDNVFLECAEAADANYLITGEPRHFPIQWRKTKVIGARELIEFLMKEED